MDKKTLVTNFKEITSTQDLIAYLSDSINRLDNTKNKSVQYVYHYTKLSNVVSIIKSRFWWLKSPKTMNDGLEFQNISEFEQSNACLLYTSIVTMCIFALDKFCYYFIGIYYSHKAFQVSITLRIICSAQSTSNIAKIRRNILNLITYITHLTILTRCV